MQKGTNIIVWLALIVSLTALGLAWISYNRTGVDLESKLRSQMQEGYVELQRELALAEIRTELALIQVRYRAGQDCQAALEQVQEVRKDINELYKDAQGQTKEELVQLNQEFDQLEQDLRSQSAESLKRLEKIIELMRRDLKTGEK